MNRKEMLQIELKFTREGVNSNKRFITDSIEALRMCRKIVGCGIYHLYALLEAIETPGIC